VRGRVYQDMCLSWLDSMYSDIVGAVEADASMPPEPKYMRWLLFVCV
jgi:hypothetical protein